MRPGLSEIGWREALRSLPRMVAALLAALAVFWILYKGSKDWNQFAVVTLNGLTLAGLYFVVASGFTLIFGLMRVVNLAHGSLFLLGGYLAYTMQTNWFAGKDTNVFDIGPPEVSVGAWIFPAILAAIAIGIIGVIMQQVFLRWNQGQDLRQTLITIALSVILADQMIAIFGGTPREVLVPASWPTTVKLPIIDVNYGFFRLVIVLGSAVVIGLLLLVIIRRTKFGMIIRAGVDDRQMVSALGINIQLIFAAAFFLGSLLAGYGGVLGGTVVSLSPGNDTAFLLNSLIVVIIGGMGSLAGAAVGALLLGLVSSYADVYLVFGSTDLTNYSILLTFLLLVAVLAVRPLGLFGRPG